MKDRKKRIVINTDPPVILKTGLAKNGRWLAEHLYKTGKYEIFYYGCGLTWDHPEFQRFPFTVHGTLPNNPQEMQQIQAKGEGAVRAASYGAYNADRVIKEFKPDVYIASNDSWSFDEIMNRSWWNKINHIPHITLDSLNFLPQQKEMFKKCKRVYVWADFAVEEAKRLGYENVELLTGIAQDKQLFKLPKHKKLESRKQLGIPENAFIILNINRNQVRKEFRPIMEGYAKWKKQHNPKNPTYLLFHTNFGEPGGWDMARLTDEFGIDKNELLTTYICRNCKKYQVKPFIGNDLDCPHCKSQKSVVNINIIDGLREEQLNEIYNLADCSVHACNSSGLELFCVESLYCELPLATNDYAATAMFCAQPFVGYISNTFTVQLGTQFKRAVPNPNDITKFLNKIYNLSEEERTKIGKQGRTWALSKFSPEVVCKQWEQIIDSMDLIDWDYDLSEPLPNPVALLDHKDSNEDYINQLYLKILNRPADPSGFQHWIDRLLKGEPRDQIEKMFRQIAQDELNKKNQESFTIDKLIDNNGKKNCLLVCPQSAGDLLYISALLRSFRQRYPENEWNLYVACQPEFKDLLIANPYITKILPYMPFMDSEIACIGAGENKGLFHSYCFLTVGSQRFLNYLSNHNINLDLKYNENKCSQFNVHGVSKGKA